MLYHLLYPLSKYFFIFNVIKYISVRSALALLTSFFLMFFLWRLLKDKFYQLGLKEKIDMYGHKDLERLHKDKKGTPTMGGLLILFSIFVSSLLWVKWTNSFLWYTLLIFFLLGLLGVRDDFLKIKKNKGISRKEKLIFQIIIGVVVGIIIFLDKNITTQLSLPFFKKISLNLGYFYILWATLVIVATSNAVNFTDGLDGLAMGGLITNFLVFAIFCYVSGHAIFSRYLFIPYIKDAAELTVLCSAVLGAGLGFLWFNAYPAEIFMGDTGALALGGGLGVIALFIKKEFILLISGGIFVIEALSVILQILSVRLKGKKIFLASPLHHHFQLKGIPESKIIVRFWIVSIAFAVLALLTLKLR